MFYLGRNGCEDHQFQCNTGDCIHISLVCNFKADCIDASDEYCGTYRFPKYFFSLRSNMW
jgi:hypothetical protein